MIGFVVLLVVIAAIVLVVRAASVAQSSEPSRTLADLTSHAPLTAVQAGPRAVPPLPLGSLGNALQPFSPIPLTVSGATPEAITTLRGILDDDRSAGRARQERLTEWLLTTNAHVREIDAFIGEWGPKFTATVKELCEADRDWASSGELDRADILGGAQLKATQRFDVRVVDLDYAVIATLPALDDAADDSLITRYGFETLSFYFRYSSDCDRVYSVGSEDYYRPRFEMLLAKRLASRGTDVAPALVLQTLTLKDMEAVAEGVEHKRFTRRAPAIEFLASLPDLRERLGRRVSLRELFQPLPLPAEFAHLDLTALSHAWAFAAEYAKLLNQTYETAARANRAVSQAVHDEYFKGWVVEASFGDTPCCPACAKQCGPQRGARNAPKLPHHVGCSCDLSQIYE